MKLNNSHTTITFSNSFKQFSHIYCISLPRCKERRTHIQTEFNRVGMGPYEFIDAYDKNSIHVSKLYQSGFVKKYPPCFRCGRLTCSCENKTLLRAQIGNWLSHIQAWKNISKKNHGLALVCEDDVKFQDNVHQSLQMLAQSKEVSVKLEAEKPVLIRLGWALCSDHILRRKPNLTQDVKMSNPCYAINPEMANLLLDSLHCIDTTSDVYLHQVIGVTVNHYSLLPPPAYELSWSTGELLSEIRPKKIRLNYLLAKLGTLNQKDPEYLSTKLCYEEELTRLKYHEQLDLLVKSDMLT